MQLRAALPAAALLLLGACSDDPQKEQTPTAPQPVAPSLSVEGVSGPSALSAVCHVYKQEREVIKQQLTDSPDDAVLQKQVKSYDSLIADVCS
jgi:hypothetical protein